MVFLEEEEQLCLDEVVLNVFFWSDQTVLVKLSESRGTGAGHHGPKMKSWCGQLPVPFMNLLLKTLVARIDFAYKNLACTNR